MGSPIDGAAGVRGNRFFDEALLDNAPALAARDPGGMLRAIASAGAQVREATTLTAETDLSHLADEGRPRAVVVVGAGTAARTGDILATIAGPRCLVPVLTHRSVEVPGWIGAADVVFAVSASGRSPEALAVAEAAGRRGARLVGIGAPGSPLQSVAERYRAPFIPVPRRGAARANLWGLTVPVLLAARALGLVKVNEADLAETAVRLDQDADRCRPTAETFVNRAKSLALNLAGSVPVIWGDSPLAAVAAVRYGDMLSANARYPVVTDALGEAGRGRVGLLDGVFGALAALERDIFADPELEDVTADPPRLKVVLLCDGGLADENSAAQTTDRRAEVVQDIAARRGIEVDVLTAEGGSALERFASLVAATDFASVYLGLGHGLDPMAVPAVTELKEQLRK
ncbi:SIS domain-containing protein [Catellatospora paridis]|uniref:SIS domain-containing protein n=1 Tax=Catellatospora paridis TaxID=1617086 RepID=UPI0012D3D603|nr:SIS domain-containing protein [Catellatospora paridis]